MIFFYIMLAMFIIGIALQYLFDGEFDDVGFTLTIIAIILTIIIGGVAGAVRAESRAQIAGFQAVQSTITAARNNPDISEIELAALQTSIVESNNWLASEQQMNRSWGDIFIDDSIDWLSPIH